MLSFDISDHIDTPEFKEAFWNWWDMLPKSHRDRFNYEKEDWAAINFFNSKYRHMIGSELED